jgi:hypothetical protein
MARYPRHIDIHAEMDGAKVQFHMREDAKPVPKKNGVECLVFDKGKHGMNKDDVHEVHFQLHAKGDCDIVFTANRRNVMWAEKVDSISNPCPCPGDCDPDPDFYVEDVSPNQKRITVINKNLEQQFFAFRLNFVHEGNDDVIAGDEYVPYDPITENQDGGL